LTDRERTQNMAGFVSGKVICDNGPQTITLRLAETAGPDGAIYDRSGVRLFA